MFLKKIISYLEDHEPIVGSTLIIFTFAIFIVILLALIGLIVGDQTNQNISALATAVTAFFTFFIALANCIVAYVAYMAYRNIMKEKTFPELKETLMSLNKLKKEISVFYGEFRLLIVFSSYYECIKEDERQVKIEEALISMQQAKNHLENLSETIIYNIILLESLLSEFDTRELEALRMKLTSIVNTLAQDNSAVQFFYKQKNNIGCTLALEESELTSKDALFEDEANSVIVNTISSSRAIVAKTHTNRPEIWEAFYRLFNAVRETNISEIKTSLAHKIKINDDYIFTELDSMNKQISKHCSFRVQKPL